MRRGSKETGEEGRVGSGVGRFEERADIRSRWTKPLKRSGRNQRLIFGVPGMVRRVKEPKRDVIASLFCLDSVIEGALSFSGFPA